MARCDAKKRQQLIPNVSVLRSQVQKTDGGHRSTVASTSAMTKWTCHPGGSWETSDNKAGACTCLQPGVRG
eukprot:364403-Chlamydomonas_euryale.AAC.13